MPETAVIPTRFKNYLERVDDEKIRKWYEKNVTPYFFVNTAWRFEDEGYEFRPNGLLIKYIASDENLIKMNMMVVNMALLRPLSEHSHEHSDELIIFKNGAGKFYHDDKKTCGTQSIRKGFEAHVPRGTKHYLKPEKDSFLEVTLLYSPAPKEGDEKCFRSFDEL